MVTATTMPPADCMSTYARRLRIRDAVHTPSPPAEYVSTTAHVIAVKPCSSRRLLPSSSPEANSAARAISAEKRASCMFLQQGASTFLRGLREAPAGGRAVHSSARATGSGKIRSA